MFGFSSLESDQFLKLEHVWRTYFSLKVKRSCTITFRRCNERVKVKVLFVGLSLMSFQREA